MDSPQAIDATVKSEIPIEEQPPVAEQIAEPAAEEEKAAEGEQIGVHDPGERGLGEAEIRPDRRQRDVHDRGVEDDHQIAEAENDQREPACAAIQGHGLSSSRCRNGLEGLDRPAPRKSSVTVPMSFPLCGVLVQMAASEAQTITFALSAPIARADLQPLCDCVCGLVERTGAGVALCDVSASRPLGRHGRCSRAAPARRPAAWLRGSPAASFERASKARRLHGPRRRPAANAGLRLGLEAGGQPEQREQPLGVEEERELDDPAVGDLEDLQRPGVVAASRLARLVLPERRRAVRGDGRDDTRAATAGTRADPPARGCRRGRSATGRTAASTASRPPGSAR